ncbi:protein tyrosine phosphatase family protein [Thioalkalivibrio sp. XN279]|uniref:protein tyrosine phosphatase family protein n=1 Tax=Thioalkalivibrio sp. XN279 TaxID=2714953 RepID=UPI00140CAD28|nr:protein tyrosine phosphatase family protein [Thioalkalivibrio sp. XN279]NHA14107.1 serine/threonine protein phosphatase [Thioalkalivibrio sp. XN279]
MKLTRTMLLAALLAGTMPAAPAVADEWRSLDEGIRPSEQLVIGGQPTAALLREAAEAGIELVVNFRPAGEEDLDYDEAALVAELGLAYLQVPVAKQGSLTEENVRLFDAVLERVGEQPALMHCSTGNRVGAMFALHAARYRGMDTEAAVALGKAHGLTHFEDEVRAELAHDAKERAQP